MAAIYFIAPSARSLEALLSDLSANTFDELWINFAAPITRHDLEGFCAKAIQESRTGIIKSVRQFWFPFLPLHENCFTLRHTEQEELARALLSLCCTARSKPIFAFSQRAERCAAIAAEVLKALSPASDFFLPPDLKEGQLLIFVYDSSADLLPNLVHSFGYAQTVSDRFGCWSGDPSADAPGQIDLRNDRFFSRNFFAELPSAAIELEAELNHYRNKFAALEASADADPNRTAEDLNEKLDSLPEMTELRKRNKLHLTLCDFLMKDAAARNYDRYAAVSLAAFRNHSLTSDQQGEVASLLRDPDGQLTDKLRLLAVIAAAEVASAKELGAWAELLAESSSLSDSQKAWLQRVQSSMQASSGYLSAFADSGKRILQARLGSAALASSARLLLEVFRRRERPEGLTFQPETTALSGVRDIICINLSGGSFLELADLLEAGKQLSKTVRLGIASVLQPATALARYTELSLPGTEEKSSPMAK